MELTIKGICILSQKYFKHNRDINENLYFPNSDVRYKRGGGSVVFDESQHKWVDCIYLHKVLFSGRRSFGNIEENYLNWENKGTQTFYDTKICVKLKGNLFDTFESLERFCKAN